MNNLERLHRALLDNNYDVPQDYKVFERTLTASGAEGVRNRQLLYKSLKDNNYDVPQDYQSFANTLFKPAKQVDTGNRKQTKQSNYKSGSTKAQANSLAQLSGYATHPNRRVVNTEPEVKQNFRPTMPMGRIGEPLPDLLSGIPSPFKPIEDPNAYREHIRDWSEIKQEQDERMRGIDNIRQQADKGLERANEAVRDVAKLNNLYASQNMLELDGMDRGALGDNPNVHRGDLTYDQSKGKFVRKYVDTAGNTYDYKTQANDEQDRMDAIAWIKQHPEEHTRQQLDRLNENVTNAYDNYRRYKQSAFTYSPYYGGGVGMSSSAKNDLEWQTLSTAKYALDDAYKTIREAETAAKTDKFFEWMDSNWAGSAVKGALEFTAGAGRGAMDKLFDVRTWLDGATVNEQRAIKAALDAADKGTLTKEQKMLLDAEAMKLSVDAVFGSQVGYGYTSGGIAAESLPFMLEFAINPASAAGKTIGSRIARYALKKLGKGALNRVMKMATKIGARTAGNIAAAAAMTSTTSMPRVLTGAQQRQNGDIKYTYDANNNIVYGGHTQGDNMLTAYGKSYLDTFIDNFTEMGGSAFSKEAKVATKTGRMLTKMDRFVNLVKDFEKRTQWHGPIEEYLEEVAANIMNAATVGDMTFDTAKDTGVFNLELNLQTFAGVAITGGFISGMKTAGYRSPKKRAAAAMKEADDGALQVFGNGTKWRSIRNSIAFGSDEDAVDTLSKLCSDKNTTPQQRAAALEYAKSALYYKGVLKGEAERATDTKARMLDEAYGTGYNMKDVSNMRTAKLRLDTLRNRLSEFVADDKIRQFDSEPLIALHTIKDNEQWSQEEKQDAIDYVNAKAVYDGMIQAVRDDINSQIAASDEIIDNRIASEEVGGDGMIHPATLKRDERKVYVLSGNVVLTDDGDIDYNNSDKDLIVADAKTGEREFVDLYSLEDAGEAINPEAEKQTAAEAIRESVSQTASDMIDGKLAFAPNEEIVVMGEDGTEHVVHVVGDVDKDNVAVTMDADEKPVTMPKERLQAMYDTNRANEQKQILEQQRSDPYTINADVVINTNEGGVSGVVISPENEDGLIEVETDVPINGKMVNLFTRDELDELTQKEQGDENTSDEVDIENFQPTGKNLLGNLYNQFKGKAKDAINFLLKKKEGNAVAALHHKDVGDIDLWYGNDKAGLKKIAEKHPEVLDDLQGIIDGMRVVQASENRVVLESDTHKAVVSKMLGNEKTDNWLLSAYEKKDISGGSSDIGPEPEGKQNGTAPLLNELSAGKDSENSDTNQTNNQGNADDVLVERLSNHTPESAQGFINNNVESLNKELAKAKKKKSKATDFDEYERETAENEAEVQRLEAELERWNTIQQRVNDIANEKKAAAQAEQKAKDEQIHNEAVAQAQAEYEERKQAEAERKAVGNENPMPAITDKWNNAEKVDGAADEIMLPNGEVLKGHYVLHESGASSPSHNALNGFTKTDGFPMDANDNSVNDRDYERDKDAQEHTKSIAGNYDQRALQDIPVVSNDGVVLSGNGRAMAGEIAAKNGTDTAYNDYLKKYAHKFGFTPEQVEGMQHPRVSFVPDAQMPYTAETFAKFNQQAMKSQNNTEQAVKLGKTVSDDVFKGIVKTINGYDTLGEFYNDADASLSAVYALRDAGVIPQAQLAEMVDGVRGQEKLSAVGREYLENMLIGKAFANEPDTIRMLTAEPAMRQSVITALGEIADNIALGDDWNLQQELSDAVKLCFDARQSGAKHGDIVSVHARQGELFADPDELKTVADFKNATMLMLADVLNDKRVTMLKNTLALYNNDARESASGQADLFSGDVKSREDILRNVLNYINNGKKQDIEAAKAAAVERRKAESIQQNGIDTQSDAEGEGVENIPVSEEDIIKAEEELRSRIEMLDDEEFTEDSKNGEIYHHTILVDGKHKVEQIDEPNDKGDYTGSYFMYDNKRFAGIPEAVAYIDEQKSEEYHIVDTNEKVNKNAVQGLEGYSENELLDAIRGDIETKLEEAGISDVVIKGMALNGSRLRGDAKAGSDLDVVVEYEGDMSEDGLFNILNEEPVTIEGVKVDINPITKGKSGTLDEYMKRSRQYDEEQKSKAAQNEDNTEADAEVETYHIGDQFEIIDKDGNPNLCRITGIDADGNIEIVAGRLGQSYKETVTPSTLDMYRERKQDYDTRNEMRYFISNVVDDEDVTFVNKITTEELKKFKHLVDVWDELPDGTKDKKESYDEVEDYITQLRKAYPVEDNTAPNKYDEYRGDVEKEIADIENRLGPDNSEKNDKLIQQISDIMVDAENMLENDTLSEDERTRYQARYDAADKWLDDNVRGEGVSNTAQSGKVDEPTQRYHKSDANKSNLTKEEEALRDAVIELTRNMGLDVITDTEEGQKVLDMVNGGLSKAQKRALETAVPEDNSSFKATVVSSADGAKVLKNLDTLKQKLDNLTKNNTKPFFSEVAKALGAKKHGSNSQYATFETKNGNIVTIRLADHNAKVSTFDNHGENEGISIVISRKQNEGINNDGNAHIVEFFYSDKAINKAEGKPLADIVRAIQQSLYSGEFNDPTGIAERTEVNAGQLHEHRVYHGSGADFDAFDHSHMGEGEGAQSYGWGTYVTEVEGIGKTYANAMARKPIGSRPVLYKGEDYRNANQEGWSDAKKALFEDIVGYMQSQGRSAAVAMDMARSQRNHLIQLGRRGVERSNIQEKAWNDAVAMLNGMTDEQYDKFVNSGEWIGLGEEYKNLKYAINDNRDLGRGGVLLICEEGLEQAKKNRALYENRITTEEKNYELLEEFDESDFTRQDYEPILYTVEVPEETEAYYIDYKGKMGDQNGILDMVDNSLAADGWKRQEIDSRIKFTKDGMQIILTPNQSGADLYAELSDALGSDKAASEFLSSVGITGIKFPAEYRSGGREDGASNYVIFNEDDLTITDKARFFKTPEGDVYGYTLGGKIYIDPRVATAETPIHEYAHLWAEGLKNVNPKAWETLKNRMEGMSDVMAYVKRLYPELEGDDLCEEVFTHYAGKRGAERLRAEQQKMAEEASGVFEKARIFAMFEKLRKLLHDFWTKARDLFAGKVEGVEKLSGEDFADMMLGDLLGGFKPDGGDGGVKYGRRYFGGNSGYVGYSMSKRASQAREEGRFPKTDFKKEYSITDNSLNAMLDAGLIDNDEWHHTSMYGNRTVFYGWKEPWMSNAYSENKKEIDRLARTKSEGYIENINDIINNSKTQAIYEEEQQRKLHEKEELQALLTSYNAFVEKEYPVKDEYDVGGGIVVKTYGKRFSGYWEAYKDGVKLTKRHGRDIRNNAFDKVREILRPISFEEWKNSSPRYHKAMESIEDVNDRFNEELSKLTEENADSVTLSLGSPSDVLLSAGVEDKPMKLYGNKVIKKMKKHGFSLEELRDLPNAVANPIAVFNNYDKKGNRSILTELKTSQGNVLVTLTLGKDADIDFNIISSVFGKRGGNIVDWINKGLATYIDKEKAHAFLSHQSAPIAATAAKAELNSAAKVIENFENPKISTENFREGNGAVEYPINRNYSRAQREATKEREARRIRERVDETVSKLGIADDVTILEDNSTLEGKKAKAKGWFDPQTGKITIVLGNHASASDVMQTVLHEGVAHRGLRELFGENFNTFLDNVYKHGSEEVKQRIDELAKKYDGDIRTATEEYLAELAESTDFERPDLQSWWRQIKRWFLDMLDKVGLKEFDGELSDNELRYILWRSYENLAEPNRYNNVFATAKDIAKQYELGVGNFAAESMVSEEEQEQRENKILFRDFSPRDRQTARDVYNDIVTSGRYQFQEAMQDSMLGLKELYKAVLGRGTKIEDVVGNENAYLAENRMSSVNTAEQHLYFTQVMSPLLKAVYELVGEDGVARKELTDYMMAKHGLERNQKFAERDALEAKTKGKDYNGELQKNRKRDYAGLTALTGMDDVRDAEAEAQRIVDNYESLHDTTALWQRVKDATQTTLAKLYKGGIFGKNEYDNIRQMFDYYIPLRGWDEKTSDEVYGYLTSRNGFGGSIAKKAKGRSSKADDPIATIAFMADAAIRQANRNLMKQRFLTFVQNNPSDLVSVNKLWLQYDDVSDTWEPVFADIKDTDTAEEVERKVEEFEERMQQLAQSEPDKYKHGKDAANIPYKVVKGNEREHQVLVKRNGETYVLTINGNPRAAQALNGLTNPDVDIDGVAGKILKAGEWVNRQLSAAYTTRNPDFIVSNFFRDMLYSNCMTWVKESPKYARRFHMNFALVNPTRMLGLYAKWEMGKLDDNDKIEKLFGQFMANGGETGFTNIKDIEGHKKDIAKELKRQGSEVRKAANVIGEALDVVNRSVENTARFAAFVTSREMGRSIDRCIYDAKEVSVNFNKKGSGSRMLGTEGQDRNIIKLAVNPKTYFNKEDRTELIAQTGSYISGAGRLGFVFWNAGIQGLTNISRAAKYNKTKAAVGATMMFALGALMPYVAMLMAGGDDDDNNAYYNLPEYVRRSNICINAGDAWITIPLPIEYRAIYGLGELAYGVLSGHERYSDGELAKQILSQVSQLLPIDFMEGGGGLMAFVPSAIKPIVEVYNNKSWSGLPIYKKSEFNENDPEAKKVYSNTNKYLVAVSKWLNELGGGDDVRKSELDLLNPAQLEYILRGYFGGYFEMPNKLIKMAETTFSDREFDWKNMLIANRLVKSGDERTEGRKLREEYYKYKDEYEKTKHDLKGYEEKADNEDFKRKLGVLKHGERGVKYEVFDSYRPLFDAYHDAKKDAREDVRREIEKEEMLLQREMVDLMHAIEDDKNPDIDKRVDDMLKREFEYGGIPQKSAANTIAKRMGGRDTYGNPKSGYAQTYYWLRDYTDLAQDVALQAEEQKAKESGDTDRAKRIAAARREVTSIKKDLAELPFTLDDGTEVTTDDVMKELREVRSRYLEEFGITRKQIKKR